MTIHVGKLERNKETVLNKETKILRRAIYQCVLQISLRVEDPKRAAIFDFSKYKLLQQKAISQYSRQRKSHILDRVCTGSDFNGGRPANSGSFGSSLFLFPSVKPIWSDLLPSSPFDLLLQITMRVKVNCCRSCQKKAKTILEQADGVSLLLHERMILSLLLFFGA